MNNNTEDDIISDNDDKYSDDKYSDDKYSDELEESEFYVKIMNNFMLYYKKKYPDEPNKSMLHDIKMEKIESTNHKLELFYELLHTYNNDTIEDKKIITNEEFKVYKKNNTNIVNEYFGLCINDNIVAISKSIFSLLLDFTTNYENIKNDNWTIIDL